LPGQVWNFDPPIYTSGVAGMTDVYHCAQLLVETGVSQTFFAWAGFELPSS
jgi:hypothetical protein